MVEVLPVVFGTKYSLVLLVWYQILYCSTGLHRLDHRLFPLNSSTPESGVSFRRRWWWRCGTRPYRTTRRSRATARTTAARLCRTSPTTRWSSASNCRPAAVRTRCARRTAAPFRSVLDLRAPTNDAARARRPVDPVPTVIRSFRRSCVSPSSNQPPDSGKRRQWKVLQVADMGQAWTFVCFKNYWTYKIPAG